MGYFTVGKAKYYLGVNKYLSTNSHTLIMQNLFFPFAYHKIISDTKGTPTGFTFLQVNEAFEEISGLASWELVGKTSKELFPGTANSPVDWVALYGRVALQGKTACFEHYLSKNNSWYEVTVCQDKPGFTATILRNITPHKESEQKLKASEKKYTFLADNMADMVWIIDVDMKVRYVSPSIQRLLGFTPDEVKNKALEVMITPQSLNLVMHKYSYDITREYDPHHEHERGVILETEYYHKSGSTLWMENNIKPIRNADGKLIGLYGVSRDISDRKKAEAETEKAHLRLLKILDNLDALIYVADIRTYEVLYINKYGYKLWGDVVGKKCWEVLQKNQEGPCKFCTNDRLLDTEGKLNGVIQSEIKNTINGRWYDCRDTALHWIDGRLVRLEIATDITRLKVREEKILYMSFHDTLTGLYNRAYMEEEMKRLNTERQLPSCVIMTDVNNLKLVNDTFGHDVGDSLLKAVARILRSSCREEDIIARWGGDEFLIFLPQTEKNAAHAICEKISRICSRTDIKGIPISISFGIVERNSLDMNINKLLKKAENRMYNHKIMLSREVKQNVLKALYKNLETKNNESRLHLERMRKLARIIGVKLRLPGTELKRLDSLVVIRDVGKITIPDEILNKQQQLTGDEWEKIKEHPETGYRIAKITDRFANIAEEILAHHENWDGSGYPRGLKENQIPQLSRIISIVEAYAAMASGRPGKKPLTRSEAVTELKRCAGTQFDPHLVNLTVNIINPSAPVQSTSTSSRTDAKEINMW